jgi:hypothetical protein
MERRDQGGTAEGVGYGVMMIGSIGEIGPHVICGRYLSIDVLKGRKIVFRRLGRED